MYSSACEQQRIYCSIYAAQIQQRTYRSTVTAATYICEHIDFSICTTAQSQQQICGTLGGTSLLWRCLPRRAPFAVIAVCGPVAYTAAHRVTHEPGTGRQRCERLTDRLVEPIEVHANSQLPSAFIGSLEPRPPPQSPVTIRVPKMRPNCITMSPGATCCSSASHLQRKHW